MAEPDLSDLDRRMNGALEVLRREFAGLRTGRASVSLLEPIQVSAYGANVPMTQVGTIGVPEPRLLTVQVWDRSLVSAVESAIREANPGLNPILEGHLVRVPIPELSGERRIEITKIAGKYGEQARVSVRNVRRDGMYRLKGMEKEGEISEDLFHELSEKVQKLTDSHIKKIDEVLEAKNREIMQV